MSPARIAAGVALAGCVLAMVGFFLPWGPARGARPPASTAYVEGPCGSIKLMSADGGTRVVGNKFSGQDESPWGYLVFILGLAGAGTAVAAFAGKGTAVVRKLLPIVCGLGVVLVVLRFVLRLAQQMRLVGSFDTALSFFAPFGDLRFSAGFLLAAAGFVAALIAALRLLKQGRSAVKAAEEKERDSSARRSAAGPFGRIRGRFG